MANIIQNLLIVIGLIVVAGLGYYLFVMDDGVGEASVGFDDISITSAQMLRQLSQIQTITIDTDIFSDGRFQSLRSFEPPVVPVSVGNTNPFGQ